MKPNIHIVKKRGYSITTWIKETSDPGFKVTKHKEFCSSTFCLLALLI